MPLYFIEIQPRIQAAHVALSTHSSVSFMCNSIKSANVAEGIICSWKTPKLVLSNKPVVNTVPRIGLCLRFKTERDFVGEQMVENAFSAAVDEGEPHCCAVIRCGFCNNPLIETNNVFKRVLPLPSEGWYECNAFCHGDPHMPSQLTPREGDLLYGESLFLVDARSLSSNSYALENGAVVCTRCRSVCGSMLKQNDGEVSKTADLLCCCKIELNRSKVHSMQSAVSPQVSTTCPFAQKLYGFSKSKEVFRFKVCDLAGRAYVSIWLMNSVSRIIHNCADHLKTSLRKFIGQEVVSAAFVPNDGYVLKLMYKSHLGGEERVCVGMDEEAMRLDAEECLKLLLMLIASTCILPPSQRTVQGFKIGLLSMS